jgi:hypothetical protein
METGHSGTRLYSRDLGNSGSYMFKASLDYVARSCLEKKCIYGLTVKKDV